MASNASKSAPTKGQKGHDHAGDVLREYGLGFPGAHLKAPWPEHKDLAVKNKTFAYISVTGKPLSISCKLPQSGGLALSLPFASPTGYGLGKSGWVTATFERSDAPPTDLLQAWIYESYLAQAPKSLSKSLRLSQQRTAVSAPQRRRRSAVS